MHAPSTQQGPRGLKNLGNTCFVSAVMQALAHCEVFYNAVRTSSHSSRCESERCILCAVEQCILDLRRPSPPSGLSSVSSGPPLNPTYRVMRVLLQSQEEEGVDVTGGGGLWSGLREGRQVCGSCGSCGSCGFPIYVDFLYMIIPCISTAPCNHLIFAITKPFTHLDI
jgi:hypothetical protein